MSAATESTPEGHFLSATNTVRDRVVRALAAYVELAATMREFEQTFSAQVLHTAQQLHEIVAARVRLELEYRRIRDKAERGGYGSDDELEEDILDALTAEAGPYEATPEVVVEPPAEDLDPATKERIVREFKRVVLPNVHADTSATPYAIFEVAYGAYRARDHTVMEAFVIEYRGVLTCAGDDGRTLTTDQLATRLSDYEAAQRRLDTRHAALRESMTEEERTDPAGARARMARQQEDFRRAIIDEADRLRELRERLEALATRGAAR